MEGFKMDIKKTVKKLFEKDRGFTLVEIIVVLVILAILAAFTIPTMLGFVNDARGKAYIAEAREVYVAAQATATELSATTDIMDGNIVNQNGAVAAHGNQTAKNGLAVSVSSYMITQRWQNFNDPSPQYQASHKMWDYLEEEFKHTNNKFTSDDIWTGEYLVGTAEAASNPPAGKVAWLITIGQVGGDSQDGKGINGTTRTGRVVKLVYKRDGYCVTIEDGNASVTKYTVTP